MTAKDASRIANAALAYYRHVMKNASYPNRDLNISPQRRRLLKVCASALRRK